ncbi:DUF4405 domain-containing protein [Cereibacter changlensis]|uniref:DUF4405 domain-containing protein n=1 Tax=Cereibacter changlensis TaxID=402884 RepID=A0A4U0Z2N8_9RHOB|nr:DUF4405 domain-containing protein [Cereibacter changlensis]TKA97569.1 DUF4405 domain-containing protein [Cereibacter changlensis]
MPPILNRYTTPFITGLFLVSTVSGLALFFHIGPSGFHGMHEWLSLLLILPFVLHLWKNWRPLLGYLKHRPMLVALAASTVAGAVFLIPTGQESAGGPPQLVFAHRLLDNPVAELAPLLDLSPEALTARLAAEGVTLADPATPVAEAIRTSGLPERQVLAAMLAR